MSITTTHRVIPGFGAGLHQVGMLLAMIGVGGLSCLNCAMAEDLAVWTDGTGTIGKAVAVQSAVIANGTTFTASDAKDGAHVGLTTAPGSTMALGPNASATLSVESDKDGKHLILVVNAGAVEVNIKDKGAYNDIHARGAAMDVRITGTLFVFQRVRRDSDYVALINGHVTVRLRKDIAEALGKNNVDEVALLPHQGLPASTAGGLGAVEAFAGHPSVLDSHTLHSGEPAGPTISSDLTTNISKVMIETTTAAVFEDIDKGVLSIQILGTALNGGGAVTPLGPPPGHPGH